MIGRITGTLLEKVNQQVLVDVQGVAYELEVPLSTLFNLPETGSGVVLHTHFVVREDAQLLYGFADVKERSLFRVLIRINGVGPKMALAMLSGMEVSEFVRCVHQDDVNALVKLPGVGKKTAERLIIEARDRLSEWAEPARAPAVVAGDHLNGRKHSIEEAETALISLGYKPQDSSRAVIAAARTLEEGGQSIDSESLIRAALKRMHQA